MSHPVNEDILKKLREAKEEIEALKKQCAEYKSSEIELSNAYLRIRAIVSSWKTDYAGLNRFEETERIIRDMQKKLTTCIQALEETKRYFVEFDGVDVVKIAGLIMKVTNAIAVSK